jgi:hypothetical protein
MITPYQPIPILLNNTHPTIFHNNDIITIASDGGLLNDHSTFGVIISINNTIVTEMHGSLPRQIHPTSLTSEAYGCYYALQKIHERLNKSTSYSCMNILLDNKSLISHIKEQQKFKPFPTACLKSEFEIISAIVDLLRDLPNTNIKHTSSKTHDDNNIDDNILHSLSHHLAQDARQDCPIPEMPIPQIHTSCIELLINNYKVSSNYLEELRIASAKPLLWQYYKEKYNWTKACINSIDWKSHGTAISYFTGRTKKTILQYIHKWLPLIASHSLQAEGSGRLCPFCHQSDEDHHHFLACQHNTPTTQWQLASTTLQQKLNKYSKHIHPTLIQLLILSLTTWRTTPKPQRPAFLQPQFYDLFQKQSDIGWNHVINGRLSTLWYTIQHNINPNTPSTWVSYTIRQVWTQIHDIWTSRCDTNHGNSKEDKRRRALLLLAPKIQTLFDKQHLIADSDKYNLHNHHRLNQYKKFNILSRNTLHDLLTNTSIKYNIQIQTH